MILVCRSGIVGHNWSAVHIILSVPIAHDRDVFSDRPICQLHGGPVNGRFFQNLVFPVFLDIDLPGNGAIVSQIEPMLLGVIEKLLRSSALAVGFIGVDDRILVLVAHNLLQCLGSQEILGGYIIDVVLPRPVEVNLSLGIGNPAASLCPGALPFPMHIVRIADAANVQLVFVHGPAVHRLLQPHRKLIGSITPVQGRAAVIQNGSCQHLGVGIAHVGQIGSLPGSFQCFCKGRNCDCNQNGNDCHHNQHFHQRKAFVLIPHSVSSQSIYQIFIKPSQ